MAGLGESCSHVGSLLWAVEAGVRLRDSMTVTQKKAYWVIPTSIKEVPYSTIKDIKLRKSSLNDSLHSTPSASPTASNVCTKSSVSPPSVKELESFFNSLSLCSNKPAILSVVKDHSDKYIPTSLASDLPSVLTDLYKPDHLSLGYYELLQLAIETTINVTPTQVLLVEEATRGQLQSRIWNRMRAGRITASKFRAACHTNPTMPSESLVLAICHPELSKFKSAATIWGCDHERIARDRYASHSETQHETFTLSDCGFFICTEYPFIGASPDGVVACLCCGDGICEVKASL